MTKSDIILDEALAELVVECKLAFNKFTLNDQFTLNLYNQLSRSAASAALNYAEGTGSGSDRDYANKLRIAFKEMREVKQTMNILISLSPDTEQIQMFTILNQKADRLAAILYTCCRKAEAKFK